MLLTAAKHRWDWYPQISRFFQIIHTQWIFVCHTATLTNFLCYTLISQIQGKSACWLYQLSYGCHTIRVLGLFRTAASILRRPQGFCYWLLYDDTQLGTTHSFHAFLDIRIARTVDCHTSIPIWQILLTLASQHGWKTALHWVNHVLNGKSMFRSWLSCSSGRRFHQISLFPLCSSDKAMQYRHCHSLWGVLLRSHQLGAIQQHAVHRIRTCKPFLTNDFQDRFFTTQTYGKRTFRILPSALLTDSPYG